MLLLLKWDISPEIFRIGGFALRYYSLGFLLAFTASYMIFSYMLKREGKEKVLLDRLLVYIIVGTLAGARLGHCLFYEFGYFSRHPWEIILPFSFSTGHFEFTGYQGLASHGGAVGILLAGWLFARKYQVSYSWLLDRLAVVVPLAGCFVRLGNFFNSEIIGRPTDLPWAVVFSRVDNIPRHPGQLYEAICYLVIFALLFFLYTRNTAAEKPGYLLGLFLVLVFSARFFIEFVKENQEAFENTQLLNMGQLLSLPLIAAGIYLIIFYRKNYGKN
ncbi:MAG TPA: prolipoprotein diacylglyceryl transferase [Chitinophaga sp.]|uniref:prolipoprotein diacylglyceryl transferase n=1 Tax=Chitinophaga sp. TaxID=1869181 RepID=UPI002B6179B2|nr:prolipoprotein diacylglyceryl transferase [Chitinophaga sp.]HVI46434.1 prolipoprotein diacylglyceryl transferase [Chitinophaga sp.]